MTHGQLLQRKASKNEIAEAKESRERWQEEAEKREKHQAATQLNNVRSWLNASQLDQEDELDELSNRCHDGTCDWAYNNSKIKSWIQQGPDHSILWLKGKPGSGACGINFMDENKPLMPQLGKSVLCSKLIQKFQNSPETTMLYFLCTEAMPGSKQCKTLFRAIVTQLVQKQPDLCAFIQNEFVNNGHQASVAQLRQLLPVLLSAFSSIRIIVDGLDECDEKEQNSFLTELTKLAGCNNSSSSCKILISSQDFITISRSLRKRSSINLSQERAPIQTAISRFVRSRITRNHLLYDPENSNKTLAAQVEQTLVNKADGLSLCGKKRPRC
jgi:NACHT domain